MRSVYFVDSYNGWAVGYPNIILNNTDGGLSWNQQTNGTIIGVPRSVHFKNTQHGWIAGEGGTISYTTNGGELWIEQCRFKGEYLHSLHFVNGQTGWAVGSYGIILKTTDGGVSFVEEKEIDEIPATYLLSQNYPNPFNPSTKIRYSVPQPSNVVIKVFDILGNEIETLVNEQKATGTYELTWYAKHLPSGVYFYQLQAGDYINTKKMVLLK